MSDSEVKVTITGTATGLEAAMQQASAAVTGATKEIRDSLVSMKDGLDSAGESIRSAFEVTGILMAVEAIEKVGERLMEMADRAIEIKNMSEILGVTTDQFQAMDAAAEGAGVSANILFRASEKLMQLLLGAREGNAANIDSMKSLGITLDQIHDPAFKAAELLAALSRNLNDAGQGEATMQALTKELGARMALAAGAIKELSGETSHWKDKAEEVNAMTPHHIERLKEIGVWWKEVGTWIANASAKAVVAAADMAKAAGDAQVAEDAFRFGGDAGGQGGENKAKVDGAAATVAATSALARKAAKDEMEATKDAVASFKEGTQQRLDALKTYAAQALAYYGSDQVDVVRAANRAVIEETRRFHEEQLRAAKTAARELDSMVLAGEEMETSANRRVAADQRAMNALKATQYKEARQLDQQAADAKRALGDEDLAHEEMNLRAMADLGTITRRQELEGLTLLEQAKYKLARDAAVAEVQFRTQNGLEAAKATTALELLEKQHATNMAKLNADLGKQMAKTWADAFHVAGDGIQSALSSYLRGTATAKEAALSMMANVADGMANLAAKNIAGILEQAAVSKGASLKAVMGNAAEAGSAAMASAAKIPYVGWILAPAAGAAVYAATIAFASAAKGYDIPAGVNPVTQLHEQEMVLPKEQANAVRRMAQNGGGGGGGGNTFNINAVDAHSVKQLLMRNDRTIARALQRHLRTSPLG